MDPTPAEKRAAAQARLPSYGDTVGKGVHTTKRRSARAVSRTFSAFRGSDDLATRVTNYSNQNHLTYSEGMRVLLEAGLEREEAHEQE